MRVQCAAGVTAETAAGRSGAALAGKWGYAKLYKGDEEQKERRKPKALTGRTGSRYHNLGHLHSSSRIQTSNLGLSCWCDVNTFTWSIFFRCFENGAGST